MVEGPDASPAGGALGNSVCSASRKRAQSPEDLAPGSVPMKKDDRRLRIGVLGCGPIAQFAHFDAVRKSRNADLAAICDLAPDLLERMAAVHRPAKTFADFDAMLADPAIDAVIVAVADQFHV